MIKLNNDIEYVFLKENEIWTTLNPNIKRGLIEVRSSIKCHQYNDRIDNVNHILDQLQNKFKIELISTNDNCGGYFDPIAMKIAVHKDSNDLYNKEFYNTICHEFGHAIQQYTENLDTLYHNPLLSHKFRLEQQCEMIATELSSMLFDNNYIRSYNDINSIIFLNDWYGKWVQNDMLIGV